MTILTLTIVTAQEKLSEKHQFSALMFVNRNEKIVPLQRQNMEVATAVINRRNCEN